MMNSQINNRNKKQYTNTRAPSIPSTSTANLNTIIHPSWTATITFIKEKRQKKLIYATNRDLIFVTRVLSYALIVIFSVLLAFSVVSLREGNTFAEVLFNFAVSNPATGISLLLVFFACLLCQMLLVWTIRTKRRQVRENRRRNGQEAGIDEDNTRLENRDNTNDVSHAQRANTLRVDETRGNQLTNISNDHDSMDENELGNTESEDYYRVRDNDVIGLELTEDAYERNHRSDHRQQRFRLLRQSTSISIANDTRLTNDPIQTDDPEATRDVNGENHSRIMSSGTANTENSHSQLTNGSHGPNRQTSQSDSNPINQNALSALTDEDNNQPNTNNVNEERAVDQDTNISSNRRSILSTLSSFGRRNRHGHRHRRQGNRTWIQSLFSFYSTPLVDENIYEPDVSQFVSKSLWNKKEYVLIETPISVLYGQVMAEAYQNDPDVDDHI